MRAVTLTSPGVAENMQITEVDAPKPSRGEVLISVAYAGVNRPDVFQRMGLYPPPPGASPLMGLEVSGEIAALGEGVEGWKLGDKVCALCNGGGYAEQVVVPAGQCLAVPAGISMAEAAALPETCFTVWTNVFDRSALKSGESLLIHGGASGIGTTAIQMAKGLGAKVFATVGSEEKRQACLALGADVVWNYRSEDFVEQAMAETDRVGIDVILDMVGGDYFQKNIDIAAKDGRIVNIAFLRGPKAEVDFRNVMLKRLHLSGSTLRPQSDDEKTAIAQSLLSNVWPLLEQGKMKPLIAKQFNIENVADAHLLMESNALIGKVVLSFGRE